jgi:hypothetical protein
VFRASEAPCFQGTTGLDAETEIYVLLVTGVGVEVVGSTAVELVTLAKFASYKQAESDGAEAGRDPAHGLDERGLFLGFIFFAFARKIATRKGESAGDGNVLP